MWIELKARDGHVLDAYCVQPATPRGAIVVLQEIFGVNPHIQSLCDRYGEQGYLAIAPALFDRVAKSQVFGYDAAGIARGREIRTRLSDETALIDVQAAIDWAARAPTPALPQRGREQQGEAPSSGSLPPRSGEPVSGSLPLRGRVGVGALPVAVIGFCWGGTLAWLSAARLAGVSCAVAYYGTNIFGYASEAPRVPVLLHFGNQDAHIPREHVDKIAQAWPQLPLYRYDAGHGFHCDDRAAYHRPSAQAAADRTHEFLENHLKC